MVPTMTKGDLCIFCRKFVHWKPKLIPSCTCEEANLAHQGKRIKYKKGKLISTLTKLALVPTTSFRNRINNCTFCGSLVIWQKAPKS